MCLAQNQVSQGHGSYVRKDIYPQVADIAATEMKLTHEIISELDVRINNLFEKYAVECRNQSEWAHSEVITEFVTGIVGGMEDKFRHTQTRY